MNYIANPRVNSPSIIFYFYEVNIIIFTTTFGVAISRENEAFGFTAVDIPPPAAVATGQIQYTAEIFTNTAATDPFNNVQARNFSGVAAVGNS